ncbi:MAG: ATP synthase F0 subunit B [Acidobacteriota bacterium]|nr:ATP synthase F0 subunit B [Acidobacteriota bacterium]
MRTASVALSIVFCAAFALAQPQPPNAVAHGSEKVAAETAHPEEHAGEHENTKFLGLPSWLWKLVNMVAFFGVLGYFIGKPIKRGLAGRHEQIQRDAQESRERRAKADQMAADIQARLSQLENEVRQILQRAQAEGERQKQEMIAAAEAEAQKILASARGEVDNRLKHARHELTEYAGQLASERAEQILREKTTDADRQKLFRESLKQVEEVQS